MTEMDKDLNATLTTVAEMLVKASDPWWIIGSAAAALHGVRPITVGDVDVLIGIRDADRLGTRADLSVQERAAVPLFRSDKFMISTSSPLRIEFMAGFHVACETGWQSIMFGTRERVSIENGSVFVPSRVELMALFEIMGRPKDVAKAMALKSLGNRQRRSS